MIQYRDTLNAFISNAWTTLDTIAKAERPVTKLSFIEHDMKGIENWVKVGTAEIIVTIQDEKKIVEQLVESIDASIQKTYAEAELKITALKKKKQELLAITMDITS